jgi:hypothetical protein
VERSPSERALNILVCIILTLFFGCLHQVELPVAEIGGHFGGRKGQLDVSIVLMDAVILLLLVSRGQLLFYIDSKLVDILHHDGQKLYSCGIRLKQTLVHHAFFMALEDYIVNPSAFI